MKGQARAVRPHSQPVDPQRAAAIFDLLRKGVSLQARRDYAGARQAFQAVLRLQPDNPAALHGLSMLAVAAKDFDGAVAMLKRAVALSPKDLIFRCDLASALIRKDDLEAAKVQIRATLKLDKHFPPALLLSATCMADEGDDSAARKILEDVVARNPDYLPAVFNLAELCVAAGAFDRAATLYRSIASSSAPVPLTARATALSGLTSCEKIDKESSEAIQLEEAAKAITPETREYGMVLHALGKIADGSGDHTKAFEYFNRSNAAAEFPFDLGLLRRRYGVQKAIFTRAFFAERRGWGHESERPVFIVGMPRSGTTLTEQILASHPAVTGVGESTSIRRMVRTLGIAADLTKATQAVATLTPATTRRLAQDYLARLPYVPPDALRFTDKMPLNFGHLGFIALLFPHAKIIHCRRDPLDVCVSCFSNPMNADATPGDLTSLGIFYREYVRLMEHWREVLPIPIYESQYEELVASLEDRARALVDFIGLPWDPACLSFHETERAVRTPSVMQVRQPIYSSSIGRWRRYEKHLGPLKAALGDLVAPA